MNKKELGKALLQVDAEKGAGSPSAANLAKVVLNRDAGRIRLLAGFTIATWVIAGLMTLFVVGAFVFTVVPHVRALERDIHTGNLSTEQTVGILHAHTWIFLKSSILIALSVSIMTLAALLTVFLIFASRRATLRQMTANLAELSEQMKELRSIPLAQSSDIAPKPAEPPPPSA